MYKYRRNKMNRRLTKKAVAKIVRILRAQPQMPGVQRVVPPFVEDMFNRLAKRACWGYAMHTYGWVDVSIGGYGVARNPKDPEYFRTWAPGEDFWHPVVFARNPD